MSSYDDFPGQRALRKLSMDTEAREEAYLQQVEEARARVLEAGDLIVGLLHTAPEVLQSRLNDGRDVAQVMWHYSLALLGGSRENDYGDLLEVASRNVRDFLRDMQA